MEMAKDAMGSRTFLCFSTPTLPEVGSSTYSNLIDVDANLCHKDLLDDIEEHMDKGKRTGISHMVVPGSTVSDSKQSIELAKKHANFIVSTAGVHPYYAGPLDVLNEVMKQLEDIHTDDTARCVGECGLDFSEGFPDPDLQIPYFQRQVQLAVSIQKPLFLHERLAHEKFIHILEEHNKDLPPCLVHCFTGNQRELQKYIDMGFYIGITGFIVKKNASNDLQDCLKQIPLTRIMVETDAPYMGFPGCREGYPNEKKSYPNVPSSLVKVVEAVAAAMGVHPLQLAEHSTQNAKKFFQIFH